MRPAAFRPQSLPLGPEARPSRRPSLRVVLVALALVLGAAYLFAARVVEVRVEPEPERLSVRGLPHLVWGGTRLLLPGRYTVSAELDGLSGARAGPGRGGPNAARWRASPWSGCRDGSRCRRRLPMGSASSWTARSAGRRPCRPWTSRRAITRWSCAPRATRRSPRVSRWREAASCRRSPPLSPRTAPPCRSFPSRRERPSAWTAPRWAEPPLTVDLSSGTRTVEVALTGHKTAAATDRRGGRAPAHRAPLPPRAAAGTAQRHERTPGGRGQRGRGVPGRDTDRGHGVARSPACAPPDEGGARRGRGERHPGPGRGARAVPDPRPAAGGGGGDGGACGRGGRGGRREPRPRGPDPPSHRGSPRDRDPALRLRSAPRHPDPAAGLPPDGEGAAAQPAGAEAGGADAAERAAGTSCGCSRPVASRWAPPGASPAGAPTRHCARSSWFAPRTSACARSRTRSSAASRPRAFLGALRQLRPRRRRPARWCR